MKRNKIINKNNLLVENNSKIVENIGLNLKNANKFNDGVDGIMELPSKKSDDEKKSMIEDSSKDKGFFQMKKVDFGNLNDAVNNLKKIQETYITNSKKKKEELNKKRRKLFSINNINDGNIPLLSGKAELKWKIPSFQRIKDGKGEVIEKGSNNYDINEFHRMSKEKQDNDNMENEINDDENDLMNDIMVESTKVDNP